MSFELKTPVGETGGLPRVWLHFGLSDGRHRVLISWYGDVESHRVTTVTELIA